MAHDEREMSLSLFLFVYSIFASIFGEQHIVILLLPIN